MTKRKVVASAEDGSGNPENPIDENGKSSADGDKNTEGPTETRQRSKSASEAIASELSLRIRQGEFLPGEALRERQLAEEFGTSRGPVREAIKALTAKGMLTYETNRGVRVVVPSDQEVLDVITIAGALLELAAKLAAQRATLSDVRDLERRANDIDAAVGKIDNPRDFSHLEALYLRTLLHIGGNERLANLISVYVFDGPGATYAPLAVGSHERQRQAASCWRDVTDAVSRRDSDRAAQVLAENYQKGVEIATAALTGLIGNPGN